MTATVASPPAGSATRPGWLRRHRGVAVIAIGAVAAITFAALGGGAGHQGVADPGNADPEGSRALARVLAAQGVDVVVVRDAATFASTSVDADTTVVVTSTENLGESTVSRLQEHARGADLIVVEPRYRVASLFDEDDSTAVLDETVTRGSCSDGRFDDLTLDVDAATAYPESGASCFPTSSGHLLVRPRAGLTLLGSTDLISNDQITRADNAAVALRLFGQHDRLVWYVPDAADLTGDDGVTSIGSLLPRWLRPVLVLGSVALLAVMWWRGRRLGRLVSEPLPVVVTAIESTRSRARLYRKVNDRAHAATSLRAAARRRLAEHLNLPRTAADDVSGLVRDLAPYTTTDPVRLHQLLSDTGPVPGSDSDLIHLANDLADLRREVRRS